MTTYNQLTNAIRDAATTGHITPQNFHYSTEGMTVSAVDFFRSVGALFSSAYKKALNLEIRFEDVDVTDKAKVEQLWLAYDWNTMQKFKCLVPSKMKGLVSEHVSVLNAQLQSAVQIEERLLDPLLKYISEVIAKPSELSKFLNDSQFKTIDTDREVKALAKTFAPDSIASTPYESTYGKSFVNKQDVIFQSDRLKQLKDTARSVDLSSVLEKEKKIAERIDDIIEILQSGKVQADSKTVAKLAMLVESASRELEYLTVLMYYAKINIHAYNETYELNLVMLKDKN